jgi:hypothetical protein
MYVFMHIVHSQDQLCGHFFCTSTSMDMLLQSQDQLCGKGHEYVLYKLNTARTSCVDIMYTSTSIVMLLKAKTSGMDISTNMNLLYTARTSCVDNLYEYLHTEHSQDRLFLEILCVIMYIRYTAGTCSVDIMYEYVHTVHSQD